MVKLLRIIGKVLFILALIYLFPVLFYLYRDNPSVITLVSTLRANQSAFLLAIFLGKAVSIVYPPIPGNIITLAAIPVVGWAYAYTVDIAGSMLGATISYFLGRKYGTPILRWAVGEKLTNRITAIKTKTKHQTIAAFILRTGTGGILSDGLAWGASLIGFRYRPFITGHVLSHLVTTLPIFYLLGVSLSINSALIIIPTAISAWILIYIFKGKFFE